jgi:SAM-dependent methyltransferase
MTDGAGPPDYFSETVAALYEGASAERFSPSAIRPVVEFLAGLAASGDALELGVGTGRIAIPLSQRGIDVHGIDLAPAMVARLKEKPGGEEVNVTIGDFSATKLGRRFSLAYLIYDTIENLTTQDAQVACFQNVAEHLEPTGCFVVEVEVPQLQRLPPGETVRPFLVSANRLGFDEIDVATQRFTSHHYLISDRQSEVISVPYRYVWPAELDLMARMAGMSLRERWEDWTREPYTADSTAHVSVWQKTDRSHSGDR